MKSITTRLSACIAATLGLLMIGCSTVRKNATAEAPVAKPGAQLWAENCNRCHNVRSPQSYSPAQWEVAMLHMRVRSNLTAEEHTKILEFLKSVN